MTEPSDARRGDEPAGDDVGAGEPATSRAEPAEAETAGTEGTGSDVDDATAGDVVGRGEAARGAAEPGEAGSGDRPVGPEGPETGPGAAAGASGDPVTPGQASVSEPAGEQSIAGQPPGAGAGDEPESGGEAAPVAPRGDEPDTVEIPAEAPVEPETGLIGLLQSRGPQKAVLLLGGLVVALIVVVGWFVVARGDSSDEGAAGGHPRGPVAGPADDRGGYADPATTVPEAPTTTLSPEEEAELEVIEAYEAAIEARDEASAAPDPDPDHPALEETYTGDQLLIVEVEIQVLSLEGLAVRYPEESVGEVEVRSVAFDEDEGTPVAYLETCEVNDRERFEVASGDVRTVGAGPQTMELTVEMQQVDSVWKVAAIEQHDLQEGVAGCALDN
jgi:hypothetical protein